MSVAAPNNDIANWGRTGRNVSDMVKNASGIWVPARYSSYGEQYMQSVFPDKKVLCDEGSYFTITNPTPGTGIARAAAGAGNNSFSDTVALFVIKNNAPFGSIARTHLDRIRLILTSTAPATTTSMQWAIKIDNINRMPSAGARLAAGAPLSGNNMDSTPISPNTLIWEYSAADLTVPASGANARLIARWAHATGLGITGDEYVTVFGTTDDSTRAPLTAVRATDLAHVVAVAPPVTIGPQQYAVIYMWWLTAITNAQTFEYEVSVVERER